MKEFNIEEVKTLFQHNFASKKKEIMAMNDFRILYKLLSEYGYIDYSYDEMIKDSTKRLNFLMSTINVLDYREMNKEMYEDISSRFENVYSYMFKRSELKDLEIPSSIRHNLFKELVIPNHSQLDFIITLLKENKKIFDEEFDKKDLSQVINYGLHSNIIEVLKLEDKNLPHLLGLTNDGALYEFYRKTYLNNKIEEICKNLSIKNINNASKKDFNKFNIMFKKIFGLDYSKENCIKIINWRYNDTKEVLKEKNITKEQIDILNKTCDYTPKSKTLDFYCDDDNIKKFIQENFKVGDYVYSYVRNLIVDKLKNKDDYNKIKKIFSKKDIEKLSDLNINSNKDEIRKLIDTYIKKSNYKMLEDKKFKSEFLNYFGYNYPLINYNELLSKNVGFYNFSLFKNLNSIIVDYDSFGKKYKSDVFLVSYSKRKIENLKNKIKQAIDKKDEKYSSSILSENIESDMDKEYIDSLKSLLSFPLEDRYYFRTSFTQKDKQKQDDKIAKDNTLSVDNITLIGFQTNEEEKERLNENTQGELNYFVHHHSAETNIMTDYYEYLTDYTRRGIEYPINVIEKNGEIVKIISPLEELKTYVKLYNTYKYNVNMGYEQSIDYENWIMNKIIDLSYEYIMTKNIRLKIKYTEYKKFLPSDISRRRYKEYLNSESKTIFVEKECLESIKKYFDNYKDYINKIIERKDYINEIKMIKEGKNKKIY